MPFEIIHFRDAEKILLKKRMEKDVQVTLEYVSDALYGSLCKGELLRQALDEMGWRENGTLNILEGRKYTYKGLKNGVAIEGNFAAYEFILEGMLRLQLGFARGKIDMGILMLTSHRSEKSSYGTSAELAKAEVQMLYPTISLPVTIALFDLGKPLLSDLEGGEQNGPSVSADDQGTTPKVPTPEW
jgi:hypothetical protein